MLSARLTVAQARSAANEASWLNQMREYDRVLADQRRLIYAERGRAAGGADLRDGIRDLIGEVIRVQVASSHGDALRADRLWRALAELYPVSIAPPADAQRGGIPKALLPRIAGEASADALRAYARREAELGSLVIRELERRVVLSLLDRGWREHLQAMDELFNSIAIRGYGTAGLAQYRRDGGLAFNRMRAAVNRDIVKALFHLRVEPADDTAPS
jgi:preprotein translocase subunit SecA